MSDSLDIVEEMLGMAKDPDPFTKEDMAEMVLLAATEIIRLREFPPIWVEDRAARRPSSAGRRSQCSAPMPQSRTAG